MDNITVLKKVIEHENKITEIDNLKVEHYDFSDENITIEYPNIQTDVNILKSGMDEVNASLETMEKKQFVSITDFGAKCDGITDDTTAFQKALDTQKKVIIPEGDIVISDTLYYYPQQEIQGCGDKSKIVSNVINKPILMNKSSFFNTNFNNFRIWGNKKETHGIAMINANGEQYKIENVTIYGVGGDGLYLENIYGLVTSGLRIFDCDNGIKTKLCNCIDITGALIKFCSNGINSDNTWNMTIDKSIIEANKGNGVYTEVVRNYTVRNSYFELNGTDIAGCYDIFISTNYNNYDSNFVIIKDNVFSYNQNDNVDSKIKVTSKVKGGKISNNDMPNFSKTYSIDIDLKNDGFISLFGVDKSKLNLNGQDNLIRLYDTNTGVDNYNVKLKYLNSSGTAFEGDITATVACKVVKSGILNFLSFDITSISGLDSLDETRLIALELPFKRNVYWCQTGQHAVTFDGSNTDVKAMYCELNTDMNWIYFKRGYTDTITVNSFRIKQLKGLTGLRGSIIYY